jgi:hypothetical protein
LIWKAYVIGDKEIEIGDMALRHAIVHSASQDCDIEFKLLITEFV